MADPTGWVAPETGWVTGDDILNTDLVRIETNIGGLKNLVNQFGTFGAKVTSTYFSADVTVTCKWQRCDDIVHILIPEMLSPANTTNDELQIAPVTVWPAEILPATATYAQAIFQKDQNDTYTIRPGFMIIPTVNNANIVCSITKYGVSDDTDGCYIPSGVSVAFSDGGGAGNNKMIPRQTISYMV